jgi:hypothetical protein
VAVTSLASASTRFPDHWRPGSNCPNGVHGGAQVNATTIMLRHAVIVLAGFQPAIRQRRVSMDVHACHESDTAAVADARGGPYTSGAAYDGVFHVYMRHTLMFSVWPLACTFDRGPG